MDRVRVRERVSVVWYVQPYAGGTGIGRYHRGQLLAEHWRARGIDTHIFCGANHHLLDAPRAPGSTLHVGATRFHFVALPDYEGNGPRRLLNMLAFGPALRRHVARVRPPRPDVVIYSSPHLFGVSAARRLAVRSGARFLFEVRDLWPLSVIELGGTRPSHPLVRWLARLERIAYREADAVVSLLPATRAHMLERGLARERWHYVPNGIDPSEPHLANSEKAQDEADDDELLTWMRTCREDGRRVLVYAGALGVPNAVHVLLESVAALDEQTRSGLQVLLIGAGTEAERLRALARGLPARVHGQMPKQRLWRVLKAADGGFISLAPSPVFRHGVSPNKLFDYLSASLPVISVIEAGNDPVAEAGAGWSVPPGDVTALSSALRAFATAAADELATRGARARDWVVLHHAYSTLADRYAALL